MLKKLFILISVLTFTTTSYAQLSNFYFLSTYEDESLAPGVEWKKMVFDNLFNQKQVINIVEIDLNQRQVLPLDIPSCNKVSKTAKSEEAIVAINGTYFDSQCNSRNYFKIDGLTKSKNIIRKAGAPALMFDKQNNAILKMIGSDEDPAKAVHGIGGFPQLVAQGEVDIKPMENTSFFTGRHPRTAVGLIDEKTVVFAVLDGRSTKSRGMNMQDWAQFLKDYGLKSALNLDGGGSTVMWVQNKGVVNEPSDSGGERNVTDGVAAF